MYEKIRKNFRITEVAENLLQQLASKNGLTETAVIELAIRNLAEKQKVKPTIKEPPALE